MGLGFVLLFWALAGAIVGGIGLCVFAGVTALLTRGVMVGRRRAIIVAGAFPLACLAWTGFIFVFQAAVNEGLLHRDLGVGDTWHCPLPNGYQILMIDVTDSGWVYNPKTQISPDGVAEREDAVAGVRVLQVSGDSILGGVDQHASEHKESSKATDQITSYFLLDTRSGKRSDFATYDAAARAAQGLGMKLNLEPIQTVYSRYRFSWFDVFVGIILVGPVVLGFFLLVRWVLRLRRLRLLQTA